MQKKTVIEVNYRELESLIFETYGHDYYICANHEMGNDSTLRITVTGEPDKWEKQDAEDFKAGIQEMWKLNSIMEDMCCLGIIEAGEYVIDISW